MIGEAAACLSAAFKKTHQEVPWKNVVGFRNLVVSVDLEIVWKIVTEDIPALLKHLKWGPGP